MPTTSCGHSNGSILTSVGPTLMVRVGFDERFRPGQVAPPTLPEAPLPALVDTGAWASCIDTALATGLDLPIVDRRNVSGVHGEQEVNFYLAQIYVPSL